MKCRTGTEHSAHFQTDLWIDEGNRVFLFWFLLSIANDQCIPHNKEISHTVAQPKVKWSAS